MTLCYLGLGSNLKLPKRQLRNAINALRAMPYSYVLMHSSFYTSTPQGPRGQSNYCNVVVCLSTRLAPNSLLGYCQAIENNQHRVRKKHWGPRTIDIDILLYGNQVIRQNKLTVPHPWMTQRDFVLVPLLEISPNARLPDGRALTAFLKKCDKNLIARSRF